jgi:Tol biopolymer transport system component
MFQPRFSAIIFSVILVALWCSCEQKPADSQTDAGKTSQSTDSRDQATASQSQEKPGCGVIAFERGGQIYRINADGTDPVKLAEGKAPRWSADGQYINYAVIEKETRERSYWTIRWSGSRPKKADPPQVPSAPGLDYLARYQTLSPDGKLVAFSRNREIFVADATTGDKHLLAKGDLSCPPAWSPDSQWIAFTPQNGVWIVPADGGRKPEKLSDGWEPSWSADGGKIAFVSTFEGEKYIYLMNPDESHLQRVTNHPETVGASSPVWSPDSRPGKDWIGLSERGRMESAVVCMNSYQRSIPIYSDVLRTWSFSRASTMLPLDDHSGRSMDFSYDRAWIAYRTHPPRGRSYLHVCCRDGTSHESLEAHRTSEEFVWSPVDLVLAWSARNTSGGGNRQQVSEQLFIAKPGNLNQPHVICELYLKGLQNGWSPDGSRIAGIREVTPYQYAIYLVDLKSGNHRQLCEPSKYLKDSLLKGVLLAWAPDSSHLAYMQPLKDGAHAIWICDRNGDNARELSVFGPFKLIQMGFHPDGKEVHAVLRLLSKQLEDELRIIPIDGSPVRTVAQGDFSLGGLASPIWSPDGSRLIFQMKSRKNKNWQVWLVNRDGSGLTQITPQGGFPLGWSPKGRMLAYAYGFESDHFIQQRLCIVRPEAISPAFHIPFLPRAEAGKQYHLEKQTTFHWTTE